MLISNVVQDGSMTTNKMIQDVAIEIAARLSTEKYSGIESPLVLGIATDTITAMQPYVQELVEALDSAVRYGYLKDDYLWHRCKDALASLPAQWRGGE